MALVSEKEAGKPTWVEAARSWERGASRNQL